MSNWALEKAALKKLERSKPSPHKFQSHPDQAQREAHAKQSEPIGRRMLKLELTDGVQTMYGIEYAPIPNLLARPGLKILVTNVPVRRGLLLLSPSCVKVLGGKIQTSSAPSTTTSATSSQGPPTAQPEVSVVAAQPVQDPVSTEPLPKSENRQNRVEAAPGLQGPQERDTSTPTSLETHDTPRPHEQSMSGDTPGHVKEENTSSKPSSPPVHAVNSSRQLIQQETQIKIEAPSTDLVGNAKEEMRNDISQGEGKERYSFSYLKDIAPGETCLVKAFVMALSGGKLRCSETEGYILYVDVGDGIGGCVCRVHDKFVEEHLMDGTSASALQFKKKANKTAYKSLMHTAAARLQAMEGLFKIERRPAGKAGYLVHSLQPPNAAYAKFLAEKTA